MAKYEFDAPKYVDFSLQDGLEDDDLQPGQQAAQTNSDGYFVDRGAKVVEAPVQVQPDRKQEEAPRRMETRRSSRRNSRQSLLPSEIRAVAEPVVETVISEQEEENLEQLQAVLKAQLQYELPPLEDDEPSTEMPVVEAVADSFEQVENMRGKEEDENESKVMEPLMPVEDSNSVAQIDEAAEKNDVKEIEPIVHEPAMMTAERETEKPRFESRLRQIRSLGSSRMSLAAQSPDRSRAYNPRHPSPSSSAKKKKQVAEMPNDTEDDLEAGLLDVGRRTSTSQVANTRRSSIVPTRASLGSGLRSIIGQTDALIKAPVVTQPKYRGTWMAPVADPTPLKHFLPIHSSVPSQMSRESYEEVTMEEDSQVHQHTMNVVDVPNDKETEVANDNESRWHIDEQEEDLAHRLHMHQIESQSVAVNTAKQAAGIDTQQTESTEVPKQELTSHDFDVQGFDTQDAESNGRELETHSMVGPEEQHGAITDQQIPRQPVTVKSSDFDDVEANAGRHQDTIVELSFSREVEKPVASRSLRSIVSASTMRLPVTALPSSSSVASVATTRKVSQDRMSVGSDASAAFGGFRVRETVSNSGRQVPGYMTPTQSHRIKQREKTPVTNMRPGSPSLAAAPHRPSSPTIAREPRLATSERRRSNSGQLKSSTSLQLQRLQEERAKLQEQKRMEQERLIRMQRASPRPVPQRPMITAPQPFSFEEKTQKYVQTVQHTSEYHSLAEMNGTILKRDVVPPVLGRPASPSASYLRSATPQAPVLRSDSRTRKTVYKTTEEMEMEKVRREVDEEKRRKEHHRVVMERSLNGSLISVPAPQDSANRRPTEPQPFPLKSVQLHERRLEEFQRKVAEQEKKMEAERYFRAKPVPQSVFQRPMSLDTPQQHHDLTVPVAPTCVERATVAEQMRSNKLEQERLEEAKMRQFHAKPLPKTTYEAAAMPAPSPARLVQPRSPPLRTNARAERWQETALQRKEREEQEAKEREESERLRKQHEDEEIRREREARVFKATPVPRSSQVRSLQETSVLSSSGSKAGAGMMLRPMSAVKPMLNGAGPSRIPMLARPVNSST